MEEQENRLISLAVKQAENQLEKGNASSQVVCHYLKMASSKDRLERQILSEQAKLIKAKTEALESQRNVEEIYKNALKAMSIYKGISDGEENAKSENI